MLEWINNEDFGEESDLDNEDVGEISEIEFGLLYGFVGYFFGKSKVLNYFFVFD